MNLFHGWGRFISSVLPIIALQPLNCTYNGTIGDPRVQGTATIISPFGLFLTAAHCVNHSFGPKDIVGTNEYLVAYYSLVDLTNHGSGLGLLSVKYIEFHPKYDVVIGLLQNPDKIIFNNFMPIDWRVIGSGKSIYSLGFPNTNFDDSTDLHLVTNWRPTRNDGHIISYKLGEGLNKAPHYKSDVNIPSGMSGSPMIIGDRMCGIANTGMSGFSTATSTACLLDWRPSMLNGLTLKEHLRVKCNVYLSPCYKAWNSKV